MIRDEVCAYAIKGLTKAVEAHEKGDFLSVGDGYDDYDQMLTREESSPDDILYITLMFWEAWADTAEHTWRFYPPFVKDDWPKMARTLLEDLKADRKVTDGTILTHFVQKPRSPKQSLITRLNNLLKS